MQSNRWVDCKSDRLRFKLLTDLTHAEGAVSIQLKRDPVSHEGCDGTFNDCHALGVSTIDAVKNREAIR